MNLCCPPRHYQSVHPPSIFRTDWPSDLELDFWYTGHDPISPGTEGQGQRSRVSIKFEFLMYWLTAVAERAILLSHHQQRASAARRAAWRGRGEVQRVWAW